MVEQVVHMKVGCVVMVGCSSHEVLSCCLTTIASCFLVVEWEVYCVVVAVLERGSWGRR